MGDELLKKTGAARLGRMSDKGREAHYRASDRNMLRTFDDSREAR